MAARGTENFFVLDSSYASVPEVKDLKHLVDFRAECRCGWSYGPGIQTDVLNQAKYHRSSSKH